jgi:NAD(P)-dependent dehydrogenase (short-subunit alcohol dehydrogenase family)
MIIELSGKGVDLRHWLWHRARTGPGGRGGGHQRPQPEKRRCRYATLREEAPQAKVEGIAADLATAAGVAAFVARVGATDILVNNLGIFEPKPFAEISDADWQRFFETNVMSGVRMSRHYLPAMVAKGWGRVVFISSESALNIPVEMVHYGMIRRSSRSRAASRNPSPALASP